MSMSLLSKGYKPLLQQAFFILLYLLNELGFINKIKDHVVSFRRVNVVFYHYLP